MKKIFSILTLTLMIFASEYTVSKEDSYIKFEAKKFVFVGVIGEFSEFSGIISVDDNNKLSNIEGIVSINSMSTDDLKRDADLKKPSYFNIVDFPNIKFSSNNITNNIVKAKVSIKGIEKELNFTISEVSISNNQVSFILSSVVDRQQFMLNGSKSSMIIADNVDVNAKLVAKK